MPLGMSRGYGGERSPPLGARLCWRAPAHRTQATATPGPAACGLGLSSARRFKALSARCPSPCAYPSRELLLPWGGGRAAGRAKAAPYSPQLPPRPSLSPRTPPGTSALPLPAQRGLRAGEGPEGIAIAGPGTREGETQQSTVLARSTSQTAHVWVIWRIKKGKCSSGCCKVGSGGRGLQGSVPAEHRQHLRCGCGSIFLTHTLSRQPMARREFAFATLVSVHRTWPQPALASDGVRKGD